MGIIIPLILVFQYSVFNYVPWRYIRFYWSSYIDGYTGINQKMRDCGYKWSLVDWQLLF